MSNYHIRTTANDLKTVNAVFHIPIPDALNLVNVNWRAALVLELGGADAITSVLTDITTEEESAMKAGSIYEVSKTIRFSSLNITNTERLAEVEAAYTAAASSVLADKQVTLNFMGKDGDVS